MPNDYWTTLRSTRLSRRRALALTAGGAAGAALLAACGGSDSSSGGGSKDSGGAKATGLIAKPEDTTKQAKRGGVYMSSRSNDIEHSDPHFTTQAAPGTAEVYSRLFRRKPGHLAPPPVEFIGDLAESWEFSPDKLQLTIKLKPNAKWHTVAPVNGRTVDANDVAYTWKRIEAVSANRTLLSNNASPSAPIKSVTATDARTVVLKMAFPAAALTALLSGNISGYLWILPVESEKMYDPRKVAIGSGPWMVGDYTPSVAINFKKNQGWHSADQIYYDEYRQPIVLEYAAGLAQFKTGAIYGPSGVRGFIVNPTDVITTKKDVPQLNLYLQDPVAQSQFAFFGWQPSFGNGTAFRDQRLRQAFSMSLDRDLWIDTVYEVEKFKKEGIDMATDWNTVLTTVWPGWWLDPKGKELGDGAKNYQFNVAEAKKLVSAAGFANGIEMKAQYPLTGYSADFVKQSQILQNFSEQAGIKLTTAPVNFATDWRPKVADSLGNFEGISFRPDATASLPDPVEFMYAGLHYKGGAGYTGFFPSGGSFQQGDPKINDLLDKARGEFDDQKRIAAIKDVQKIVADQQYIVRFPGTSNAFSLSWPATRNVEVSKGDLTLVGEWLDSTKEPLGKS